MTVKRLKDIQSTFLIVFDKKNIKIVFDFINSQELSSDILHVMNTS